MAEELGLRAAKTDVVISLGQQHGYNFGRAYPVHEDYTDRWQAINQPWEASPSGQSSQCLPALQQIYWDLATVTAAAAVEFAVEFTVGGTVGSTVFTPDCLRSGDIPGLRRQGVAAGDAPILQ